MNRMNKNIISSLVWMLVAVYVCIKSFELDLGELSNPGPGFMPFLGASMLMILNMILVGMEFNKKGEEYKKLEIKWGKIGAILLGISFYAVFVERLGYNLTTFLAMILFFKACSPAKWGIIILNSCISTIISYLIFDLCLNLRLPKGVLGI